MGISYAFQGKTFTVVALSWHRLAATGPERELKETAGVVEFITRDVFFQSEGIFLEDIKDDEEDSSFGVGARPSNKILIGGSSSLFTKGPETGLGGSLHDTLIFPAARRAQIWNWNKVIGKKEAEII